MKVEMTLDALIHLLLLSKCQSYKYLALINDGIVLEQDEIQHHLIFLDIENTFLFLMCVLYTYVFAFILDIRLTSEFYCHNYHSSQLSLSVELRVLQFGSFGLSTCSFIYSIIQKSLIGITIHRKILLIVNDMT